MFLDGLIAGYGIAIPVGAISVLIVDMSMRCGFRTGTMAAAGAATADTLFALVAVVGGGVMVVLLEPVQTPLRVLSPAVLIIIGLNGLHKAFGATARTEKSAEECAPLTMYAQFLGLTLVNPMTIVYFAALVLGLSDRADLGLYQGAVFVTGVGSASLSWQALLAGLGSFARNIVSSKFSMGARLVGSGIILGLAFRILTRALSNPPL